MAAPKLVEPPPDDAAARAYSAQEKLDLLARYERELAAGKAQREVCAELGVHRSTLLYWRSLVERGEELPDAETSERVVPRKRRVEHSLSVKQEAVRLYARGKHTVAQVADRYNVNQSTISKWVAHERAGTLTSRLVEEKPAATLPPPPLPQHAPAKVPPGPKHTFEGEIEMAQLRGEIIKLGDENARLRAVVRVLMGGEK